MSDLRVAGALEWGAIGGQESGWGMIEEVVANVGPGVIVARCYLLPQKKLLYSFLLSRSRSNTLNYKQTVLTSGCVSKVFYALSHLHSAVRKIRGEKCSFPMSSFGT